MLLLRYINIYKSHPASLRHRNLYYKVHNGTIFELWWPKAQYSILAQSINTFIAEMIKLEKEPPPIKPIDFMGLTMYLTTNRVAKQVLLKCFAGLFFYTTQYILN